MELKQILSETVTIPAGHVELSGDLAVPAESWGVVVFAHGSGSSRHSPRNQEVAKTLQKDRLATLLMDLLTPEEEQDRWRVFDIELLSDRLIEALRWLRQQARTAHSPQALFGASTGAAAALVAAARVPEQVTAVVSRGGRPDLAGLALANVKAPTLLLVGGLDEVVLQLNRQALERLVCKKSLITIPGATHLFSEPGALEMVAEHARAWFGRFLRSGG
jgi:putative phosphoribosyl transferase